MTSDMVSKFPLAQVVVYFKDDPEKRERTFIFVLEEYDMEKHVLIDDNVYFYCENGEQDLIDMKLKGEEAGEEFVVLDYDILVETEGEEMGSPWIDPMGDEWEDEDEDDFEEDPEELP